MVIYSINDLEKLSGVKAHTIRIWEKRYNIIQPKRTKTNIRYYQDQDLQLLLNVAFLNKKGLKISKIACLSVSEIKARVAELTSVGEKFENQLDALTLAMFEFDEYNFNKIINHNIQQKGFRPTMLEIIYPLLDKISMMWIAGSVKSVHESFISQIVKRKIVGAIEKLSCEKSTTQKKYLIYLPEGENHELSLLFLEYILKETGFQVLNIGTNIVPNSVNDACLDFNPDYVFTIINESLQGKNINTYINNILEANQNIKLLLTGFQASKQRLISSERCTILSSLTEVLEFINQDALVIR